jgi:hypothetical protein
MDSILLLALRLVTCLNKAISSQWNVYRGASCRVKHDLRLDRTTTEGCDQLMYVPNAANDARKILVCAKESRMHCGSWWPLSGRMINCCRQMNILFHCWFVLCGNAPCSRYRETGQDYGLTDQVEGVDCVYRDHAIAALVNDAAAGDVTSFCRWAVHSPNSIRQFNSLVLLKINN